MNSIDRELIRVARANNLPEVRRLLRAGANVNVNTPLHLFASTWHDHLLPVVKALLSGGADISIANNLGELPIHRAMRRRHSAVTKYLLQEFYGTIRRLPLHELLEDLAWIGNPNSSAAPPLRNALDQNELLDDIAWNSTPPLLAALRHDVLGTDDVVEIVEFLVEQNPEWLRARDQDGSLPLHVACRRGASFSIVQSLVKHYQASVKIVTFEGDLPLFLACDIPEPSLDTIFILMKLYPDLVYR
jgi:ankyrin repeat protein